MLKGYTKGEFATKEELREYIDFLETELETINKSNYFHFTIGALGMFIALAFNDYFYYGFYF